MPPLLQHRRFGPFPSALHVDVIVVAPARVRAIVEVLRKTLIASMSPS